MPYVKRKQTPNASGAGALHVMKTRHHPHTPAPLIRQWLALPLWTPEGLFSGAFDLKDSLSLIVIALICGLERKCLIALDALLEQLMNSSMARQAGHKSGEYVAHRLPIRRRQMVYWWFCATSELSGWLRRG